MVILMLFETKNGAIIAVHYPCLQYSDDLYFLSIDSKYNVVSKNFRTPIPREFDLGFKEKFKREMIEIPKVLSKSKDDVIDEEYVKNYAESHKRYYEMMLHYWNVSD